MTNDCSSFVMLLKHPSSTLTHLRRFRPVFNQIDHGLSELTRLVTHQDRFALIEQQPFRSKARGNRSETMGAGLDELDASSTARADRADCQRGLSVERRKIVDETQQLNTVTNRTRDLK